MIMQSAETQLDEFIDKFDSSEQALIRSIRDAVRQRLPTANELVYDNYNFFVDRIRSYRAASERDHTRSQPRERVGLCFTTGASLRSAQALQGSGNQTRFIRLESAAGLDRPESKTCWPKRFARAKPLPETGQGKLIIPLDIRKAAPAPQRHPDRHYLKERDGKHIPLPCLLS